MTYLRFIKSGLTLQYAQYLR